MELAAIWKKLSGLKNDMNNTAAATSEVLNSIGSDPAYAWATHPKVLEPIRAARVAMDESRIRNGFWKTWSEEFEFASVIKGQFTTDIIKFEMGNNYAKIEADVTKLKTAVQNFKDAHRKIHGNVEGKAY